MSLIETYVKVAAEIPDHAYFWATSKRQIVIVTSHESALLMLLQDSILFKYTLHREYEEIKLPGQQFGDVPTQKCEAYGMIERSHPVYSQDPTVPVPSQDPLYEHLT